MTTIATTNKKTAGENLIRHLRECATCAAARSEALKNGGAEKLCPEGAAFQATWVAVSTPIKFNKHHVTNGVVKARVWYSLDNRHDGRKCVTIYAKDYESGDKLGRLFADAYTNRTDLQSDYFDKGNVELFESHPLYAAARVRAEMEKR